MSFKDILKDHLFESDPQPAMTSGTAAAVARASSGVQSPYGVGSDSNVGTALYQRLAERTDLASIPEFTKLNTLMRTLEKYIPDKSTRLKAAVDQARESGVRIDDLSRAIAGLNSKLEKEKDTFEQQLQEQTQAQVTSQEAALANITAQIESLTNQQSGLRSQILVARSRLESARREFAAAFARRKAEIDEQGTQFRGLS